MAYFAPYIDAAGLHIPSYNDIRDDLIAQFKSIYGQDIYLDNDSQDYQMISAFASKTHDTMQLLQIIYNNRSPKTAVGSALDGVVKLNGIKRKAASYSTCVLTITGTAGTIITNGVAEDDTGMKWNLPANVTLSATTHQVSAVCAEIGAIEASPGTITKIVTPTKGWLSVTNEVPAVVGAPIETNETVRQRQSMSVALPSQTLIDGIIGGIASVAGVKRLKVYDNDTKVPDENGIPGNSIAAVVEGGLDADITKQVYLRKGPGCGTYGDVSVEYVNSDGLPNIINFFRSSYVAVNIIITVQRRSGYTSDTKQKIQTQIENYITGLDIGTDVTLTAIYTTVLSLITDLSKPTFSPTALIIGKVGDTPAAADITLAFKEIAKVGTITIIEV